MARFFQYQAKTDPLVPIATVSTVVFVACLTTEVIFPRSFIYQSHVEPILPPAVIVPDSNTVSASSPVIYQNKFIYQAYAKPILPPARAGTINEWYEPWSEPLRSKVLPTAQRVRAWVGPATPPTAPVTAHRPWSEPVRTRPFNTALQDVGTPDVTLPPPVLSSQWYEPWVDPVRLKQGLSVTLQQTLAWSNFTPAAAVVTDIKWSYGWAEPVRQKPGLATNLQQSLAWSTFTPVVIVSDSITVSASAPVIYQSRFIYQSRVEPIRPPAVTPVTDVKWNYPWSEPVRKKTLSVAAATSGQIQTIQPPTILVSQWYEPWIDPVKLKRGLSVALHQSLIWSNFTPTPTAVTDIKWSYGWSEPVRVRRFPTSQQQPLAFVALLKNASNIAAPYYPWSEPVRIKQGLRTHLQSFTSLVTPPQPNFVRTINWYQAWSEPVRQKKGLRPDLQQFFDTDHNKPTQPVVNVTITMSAFEINTDMFLAGFAGKPAVRANVSIKEIPAIRGAAVSLEET